MRSLVKTVYATRDLENIFDYTADSWGIAQAKKYISAINNGCLRLVENPQLGSLREEVPKPYLSYLVEKHVIIYQFNTLKLEIATIMHQSMNIEERLEKLLHAMKLH